MFLAGIDELDNKILTILEQDARTSLSEIGNQVGISRVAVKKRMEALEKKGIIKGYSIIVDRGLVENGLTFYFSVACAPDKINKVAAFYAQFDEIKKIYRLSGVDFLRMEGYAAGIEEYRLFMEKVHRLEEESNAVDGGLIDMNVYRLEYVYKDSTVGIQCPVV